MPELPEVQTIVSDLNEKIIGYKIVDFWSDWPKAIRNMSVKRFEKEIREKKILGIRRLGKNIFIDLSGGKTLYVHLKMTGHLLIKSQISSTKSQTKSKSQISNLKSHNYFDDKVNQYIHHIWTLRKDKKELTLEFSDVRKFAKIVLADTEKINNLSEIKKIGTDVMSSEFTLKKFIEILKQKKNKNISLALMEQEAMAGIGNIYRSEILFEAGIHPERRNKKLSEKEAGNIYKAIKKVLKKAIKMRGTSDSDYRDTFGAPGNFQKALRVYRKAGKKCPECGTIIKRITLGQRSVFYCSECQK